MADRRKQERTAENMQQLGEAAGKLMQTTLELPLNDLLMVPIAYGIALSGFMQSTKPDKDKALTDAEKGMILKRVARGLDIPVMMVQMGDKEIAEVQFQGVVDFKGKSH
jgi:hypothetical protein